MREPCSSLRSDVPGLLLAFVPAAVVTVIMALVLAVAPTLGGPARYALHDVAVLANLAVWFAFSPPYLVGWVHFYDPTIRARTGMLGLVALAGVLWFANLFAYACTGSLLGLLRG